MASDDWIIIPFTEAVLVNPPVKLTRGTTYPFVETAAVIPSARSVHESEIREFKGGGARFIPGDTLMARITQCLVKRQLSLKVGDN
jgi:type I restriction enzyme S subunit